MNLKGFSAAEIEKKCQEHGSNALIQIPPDPLWKRVLEGITATLLLPLKVYPFSMDDWCGYVQGAVLTLSADGRWTVAYVVPDKNNRKKYSLFI